MGYMTPAEFEDRMKEILRKYDNEPEKFHIEADKLICEALKGLGYQSGIDIFENHERWYS